MNSGTKAKYPIHIKDYSEMAMASQSNRKMLRKLDRPEQPIALHNSRSDYDKIVQAHANGLADPTKR